MKKTRESSQSADQVLAKDVELNSTREQEKQETKKIQPLIFNPIEIRSSDQIFLNSKLQLGTRTTAQTEKAGLASPVNRIEVVTAELVEASQLVCGGKSLGPSDQVQSNGLEKVLDGSELQADNAEVVAEITSVKSGKVAEKKVEDLPVLKPGQDARLSEVGHHCGPTNPNNVKRLGNLGFEFFRNPSPVELQSVGLKNPLDRGLDQAAEFVDGPKKLRPGPSSTAGPLILTQEKLDFGAGQLNKIGSSPSSNNSGALSSCEERNNSKSEDSDYFDYYHSDGNFPEDTDWYSEDSESAKFLKGKWRRGYPLRANFSTSCCPFAIPKEQHRRGECYARQTISEPGAEVVPYLLCYAAIKENMLYRF